MENTLREHMLGKVQHQATDLELTGGWTLMKTQHLEMLLQWVTFKIQSREAGKKM